MDEMNLLEEFCAAEPAPRSGWAAKARSDLAAKTTSAGPIRTAAAPWSRPPARLRRADRIPRRRAGHGWLTPLAAAGAVLAAIVVPVTVFHGPATHPRPAARGGTTVTGPGGAPPYYMATPRHGDYAVIGSTATSKVLAKITMPHARFVGAVGASASDRTFMLETITGTGKDSSTAFYLAHFHPQSRTVSLTRLRFRMPVQLSNAFEMLAMSPDATRLALAQLSLVKSNPTVAVTIITLSTGASHTWSLRTFLEPQSMSGAWSADSQRFETTWQNGPSLDEFTDSVSVTNPGARLPAAHAIPVPSGIRRHLLDQTAAPNGDVFFVNSSYLAPKWNLGEQ
jgi:hypothetical protein